jgi:Ca-activated chloride channel homolog
MSHAMKTAARVSVLGFAAIVWAGAGCDDTPVDFGPGPGSNDHATPLQVGPQIGGQIWLNCSGAWTPQGKWGAEGDLGDGGGGGGGGGGYKSPQWACLICDDQRPAEMTGTAGDLEERLAAREREIVPYDDDAPAVLYVSADDSNSQSSPIAARQRILSGELVPGDLLRVWEFLNYYGFAYDPPLGGKAIRVTAQLRPYDIEAGIYALQLGVQGELVGAMRRRLNLAWSVDTSGSMAGESLSLAQESMRAMAAHLRAGDIVSLVSWSTVQATPLESHAVTGPSDPAVLAAINGLTSSGSTDLNSGLLKAYELADASFIENGMNRVVLLSDGGANVGLTDSNLIAERAAGGEAEAIYLVGVGVGNASTYNDLLMDTVTDLGKGASVFVDSVEEAHRDFDDNFLSNLEMVAHDVQIQLTLPPTFEMFEFLGEEYSEDAADVEPQNLGPNDAMIVQQLIKTSRPDRVRATAEVGVHVTWTDALTGLSDSTDDSWTLQEMVDADADQLRKGDAIVVYVQTLGRIWEALGASVTPAALDEVAVECEFGESVLDDAIAALGDSDLEEIAALLDYYCTGLTGA